MAKPVTLTQWVVFGLWMAGWACLVFSLRCLQIQMRGSGNNYSGYGDTLIALSFLISAALILPTLGTLIWIKIDWWKFLALVSAAVAVAELLVLSWAGFF